MYVSHLKVNRIDSDYFWLLAFSNSVISRQCVYEKLEKKLDRAFRDRPRTLLVRHSVAQSEISGLLCHVNVLQVEHHMLVLNWTLTIRSRREGTRVDRHLPYARILCTHEKEKR
jgi:hypothetical protein